MFDPVFRFLVFRVIDFFWWVDRGVKVFEQATILGTFAIDENLKGVIGATRR